ncbi:MAG TPA: hypothetical protein VGK31_10360 [Thermoanaerobaculia bacterium]|jgi:hypothetical protein
MKRDNRYWRSMAGNIELFLGCYFISFGFLAVLYFLRRGSRNHVLLSLVGTLAGALLVMRARRMLGWHRWFFWPVVILVIMTPIAWYFTALVQIRWK